MAVDTWMDSGDLCVAVLFGTRREVNFFINGHITVILLHSKIALPTVSEQDVVFLNLNLLVLFRTYARHDYMTITFF